MSRFFIAATGTGIGKTLVTAALAAQLKAKQPVLALKPVISGFNDEPESDTGLLLAAQGLSFNRENIERISPWRFKAPLSPDMAAADEGRELDFDALIAFCRRADSDTVLIEGVGGVMSPLGAGRTVLDWMEALMLPVILVTGSYLGSLSHTLTACAVIKARGLTLQAVVISESAEPPVTPARMAQTLRQFVPASITVITRLDSSRDLWKHVPDLTNMLA